MKPLFKCLLILSVITMFGCMKQTIKSDVDGNNQSETAVIHSYCYKNLYGNLVTGINYEIAFRWCAMGAERSYPKSLTLLAEMYYLGLYVEQNYHQAFSIYTLAAELEHAHAQWMLYQLYHDGLGVEKSEASAQFWLMKAKSNNHKQANSIPKAASGH